MDSSDSEKMVEARDEVNRLMNEDELRDAVLLVFANKQVSFLLQIVTKALKQDSEYVMKDVCPNPVMTSSEGNIFRVTGPLCGGNQRSPVDFPHKGQWRGALMFSLICARINGWLNNREADELKRHRAHHDVIRMHYNPCVKVSQIIGNLAVCLAICWGVQQR